MTNKLRIMIENRYLFYTTYFGALIGKHTTNTTEDKKHIIVNTDMLKKKGEGLTD